MVPAKAATPVFIDSPVRVSKRDSRIYVIFTDVAATSAALGAAAALARGLNLPRELLAIQVIH